MRPSTTPRRALSTGISDLDSLLDGGFPLGSLTAIWDQVRYLGSAISETILDHLIASGASVLIVGHPTPVAIAERRLEITTDPARFASAENRVRLWDVASTDLALLSQRTAELGVGPDLVLGDDPIFLSPTRAGHPIAYLREFARSSGAAVLIVAAATHLADQRDGWLPGESDIALRRAELFDAADLRVVAEADARDEGVFKLRRIDTGEARSIQLRYLDQHRVSNGS